MIWVLLPVLLAIALCSASIFDVTRFDFTALVVRTMACVAIAVVLFRIKWSAPIRSALLSRAAAFSYTLYIVHAPLILLSLAAFQDWIGYSIFRSAMIIVATVAVVLPFAIVVASWIERPAYFRQILLAAFLRAPPAKQQTAE